MRHALPIGLMIFGAAAFGQPHDSQIQDATDQAQFVQNTVYEIRTLGDVGFAKELWKYMTNGNIL